MTSSEQVEYQQPEYYLKACLEKTTYIESRLEEAQGKSSDVFRHVWFLFSLVFCNVSVVFNCFHVFLFMLFAFLFNSWLFLCFSYELHVFLIHFVVFLVYAILVNYSV